MPAHPTHPQKIAEGLKLIERGATYPEAAKRSGASVSTLRRAKAERGSARAQATATIVAGAEPDGAPAEEPAPAELLAEVDAALADLPDVAEARILGAALRLLATRAVDLDAGRIPALANGIRTLAMSLRDLRPPPVATPDEVEERLRALDAVTKKKIEEYLGAADAALEQRMEALRAWGRSSLDPALAAELERQLDGLFSPA